MNRGIVTAVLAGAGIGAVAGALILCVWEWGHGASADPRCVFGVDGYMVVLYRLESGANRADCEYKPDIMRDGAP
jgi:hypothetical protein